MFRWRIIGAAVACVMLSGPALGDWRHSTRLGQHEGRILLKEGMQGITYSCARNFGFISFFHKGAYVAAGESILWVDGREIVRGSTQYNSIPDLTNFNVEVNRVQGPEYRIRYNNTVTALASGMEAIWETPTGEKFTFPLSNASRIFRCLMR